MHYKYSFPFSLIYFLMFSSSKGLKPWQGKVRHCPLFCSNPKAFLTLPGLDQIFPLSLPKPSGLGGGEGIASPQYRLQAFPDHEEVPQYYQSHVCLGATELIATCWSFAFSCKGQGCGQVVKQQLLICTIVAYRNIPKEETGFQKRE